MENRIKFDRSRIYTYITQSWILRARVTENDRLSLNEDFYSSSKYDTKKALTILRIMCFDDEPKLSPYAYKHRT